MVQDHKDPSSLMPVSVSVPRVANESFSQCWKAVQGLISFGIHSFWGPVNFPGHHQRARDRSSLLTNLSPLPIVKGIILASSLFSTSHLFSCCPWRYLPSRSGKIPERKYWILPFLLATWPYTTPNPSSLIFKMGWQIKEKEIIKEDNNSADLMGLLDN